jgi:hypothetical protein
VIVDCKAGEPATDIINAAGGALSTIYGWFREANAGKENDQ